MSACKVQTGPYGEIVNGKRRLTDAGREFLARFREEYPIVLPLLLYARPQQYRFLIRTHRGDTDAAEVSLGVTICDALTRWQPERAAWKTYLFHRVRASVRDQWLKSRALKRQPTQRLGEHNDPGVADRNPGYTTDDINRVIEQVIDSSLASQRAKAMVRARLIDGMLARDIARQYKVSHTRVWQLTDPLVRRIRNELKLHFLTEGD